MLLFIQSFWQALGEPDPIRRGTLLLAAFVVAGVSTTAISLFSRHIVRRLRGLSASSMRTFGEDETWLLEAGWAQHKSNGNENAIAQFNQALALNPSSVEALKGRGICYSEMGEDDLAMQDFHMWVLRAPESDDAFFHRGSMWQKLDLAGLAISDYRSALKCNASNQAARDALAELMRNSTADRPKGLWSLAALFAGEVPEQKNQSDTQPEETRTLSEHGPPPLPTNDDIPPTEDLVPTGIEYRE